MAGGMHNKIETQLSKIWDCFDSTQLHLDFMFSQITSIWTKKFLKQIFDGH